MQNKFIVKELKTRLDKFLATELKDISRSQLQRDIEAGCVLVNGEKILETKFVVRIGDNVLYHKSEILNSKSGLEATNTPIKVLYNNYGLLIIDKPAGLTVHPGAGFKGETLASALLYQFKNIHLVGEDHRPGIVHRLDKDTSGVILVASTQDMYEHLKNAFLERKVKKEYIALVLGKMEKHHDIIKTSMGKSPTDFRKQTTKNPVEAKEAVTEYKVLEELHVGVDPVRDRPADGTASAALGRPVSNGVDTYTLILVKLHTGRTHQIRVHLASIGHPLIGDELYGTKRTKVKGLNRQFLHAKKIEVQLPDKTWIEAESDFPKDLKEFLNNLNSKVVKNL